LKSTVKVSAPELPSRLTVTKLVAGKLRTAVEAPVRAASPPVKART